MGLKASLSGVLFRCGLFEPAGRFPGNLLAVFGYHRIRPDDVRFSTPFCDEVFGPTASEFERQVLWLKRHTRVLSEAELLEVLEGGRPLPGRCSMITFDDGYRDNYELAYPVLRRHGVPAMFFVPSGLVAERRVGWWDLIAWFAKRAGRCGPQVRALLERMALEPCEKTQGLMERVAAEWNVPLPDAALQEAQLMSWEQIREIARDGFAIGSHGHHHWVMRTLPPQYQQEELRLSKALLERETGVPVRSIAYPVGSEGHFTRETCQLARACGYQAAFSFATGVNRWTRLDRWAIRRVSAPRTLPFLAAKVALPRWFGRA
jgi:peptidoglycan/xylan/chitin deacetylase (PgdA/CDA1 family)